MMKHKIYLFLTIILLLAFTISCKQNNYNLLPSEQEIINKFKESFFNDMENTYPDSALNIAIAVIELKNKINEHSIVFNANRQIGTIFEYRNNYDSALIYFNKCYTIAEQNNNQKQISTSLNLLSNLYISKEDYIKATELIYEAIEINTQRDDQIHLAGNHASLGIVYSNQEVYDSALIFYNNAAAIYDSINDTTNHAITLANIAGIYTEMEDYKKSISILKYVNALNISINNLFALSLSYNNTGLAFLNSNNYDSALVYFKHSYNLANSLNIEFYKLIANFNTGRTLSLMGDYKLANKILQQINDYCIENNIVDGQLRCLLRIGKNNLLTNEYGEANNILTIGLTIAKDGKYYNFEKEFLKELTRLNILTSINSTDVNYFEQYINIDDSINKNEIKKKVAELDIRFKSAKKDYDIKDLKNKNTLYKAKQYYYIVILLLLIFSIALLFIFFKKKNLLLYNKNLLTSEKLKLHKAELQKAKLESQLKNKTIEIQNQKLRQKDQELVSSTLNLAYYSKSNKQFIDNIKLFYLKIKNKKDQNEFIETIKHYNQSNNVAPIQNFEKLFTKLHPDFTKTIKTDFPEITNRELQICAMIRLNMNTKSIAAAMFLSATTIDNIRYSVRKKMNLSAGNNLSYEIMKH